MKQLEQQVQTHVKEKTILEEKLGMNFRLKLDIEICFLLKSLIEMHKNCYSSCREKHKRLSTERVQAANRKTK